jgi:lysophospholipid acyltransferase
MTTVSRLSRANIRPLLLPAPGASPSLLKRVYDVTGTVATITCVNFITAPFMLLSIRDSVEAWRALGWYGFYIIFGGLIFFYAGGSKVLKNFHPQTTDKPTLQGQIPCGRLTATPGTVPLTPGFVPPIDLAVKEVERRLE